MNGPRPKKRSKGKRAMDAMRREALLLKLRIDGERIARHFSLRFRDIQSEHANVKARYGLCTDDGLIKIRLWHVRTKEPLRYSSLIDTLCHELAHLKHFNHGPQFKAFYVQILGWARAQGIYRPKRRVAVHPTASAAPVIPPPSTSNAPKCHIEQSLELTPSPRLIGQKPRRPPRPPKKPKAEKVAPQRIPDHRQQDLLQWVRGPKTPDAKIVDGPCPPDARNAILQPEPRAQQLALF